MRKKRTRPPVLPFPVPFMGDLSGDCAEEDGPNCNLTGLSKELVPAEELLEENSCRLATAVTIGDLNLSAAMGDRSGWAALGVLWWDRGDCWMEGGSSSVGRETSSQLGTWPPTSPATRFHTGLVEVHARDSRICSSILCKCFTTSRTRPSSALISTSITLKK